MPRVMLRAVVTDEGEGRVSAKISVVDEHVAQCRACLSIAALRLSIAFLNAIKQVRVDDDDDDDDTAGMLLH